MYQNIIRKIHSVNALFIAITMSIAPVAGAHHSTASFDTETVIEITGTVKEFQWTNPHTWIQINVEDESGDVTEWSIEGGSPGTLSRNGWSPNSFKAGDSVSIKAYPMKNGGPAGIFVGALLDDGSELGRW